MDNFFDSDYESIINSGKVGSLSKIMHKFYEKFFKGMHFEKILEVGAGFANHKNFVSSYKTYIQSDILYPSSNGEDSSNGKVYVDAHDLSRFKNNEFDRLIATCLLIHLDNPHKALMEWRRVVKPGGYLSIYLPLEPGILLRTFRALITNPKAKKLGMYNYKRKVELEHRYNYPFLNQLIKNLYPSDKITRKRFPIPFLFWQLNFFEIVYIKKSF